MIDVDGYDLSACGGTHVARTGEIGVIAIRGWERFKGGSRIDFVCGGRALRSHRELRDIVNGSIRLLSVLPAELPAAIERAQNESKDLRKQSRDLTQRLAVHEAAAFAARAEPIGPISGVVESVDGYDATGLKTLATSIVSQPGRVAALVSASTPALVVIARSPDVSVDAAGGAENRHDPLRRQRRRPPRSRPGRRPERIPPGNRRRAPRTDRGRLGAPRIAGAAPEARWIFIGGQSSSTQFAPPARRPERVTPGDRRTLRELIAGG